MTNNPTSSAAPGSRHVSRPLAWMTAFLACLGLVIAPVGVSSARAASPGPGAVSVTPGTVAAATGGVTLTVRYTAPATAAVTGTVNVVVPTSGGPSTAFSPAPSSASVSVQRGSCTSAALAPSPFTPVYKSSYPGDSPGTRVSTRVRCPAGTSFTLTYRGVTVPTRAQAYTFFTTFEGAALAAQPVVKVTPRAVSRLAVEAPSSAVAGVPFSLRVSAKDAYFNTVSGYRATVALTSTDPNTRALPASYTFTAADGGAHTFSSVALLADGLQRITATEVGRPGITGVDSVQVTNADVTIYGNVLSGMDPMSVPATVTAYDADTGRALRVLQAEQDSFMFDGMPAGRYKFGATALGHDPGFAAGRSATWDVAAVYTVSPGQTLGPDWDAGAVYIDLPGNLDDTAILVRVHPYDPSVSPGPGLAGATVTVVGPGVSRTLTTDAGGSAVVDELTAGTYDVSASLAGWFTPGWQSEPMAVEIESGEVRIVDLTLVEGEPAALEGQVLLEMDPIPFVATVTVYDAGTGGSLVSVETGVDGYYRVEGLPAGDVIVSATAPGYGTDFANNHDENSTLADVFTLVAGQTLVQSWDTPFGPYLEFATSAP